MKSVSCPICGSNALPISGPQLRWRYFRCTACAHRSLSPVPTDEELTRYYNGDYTVPLERYLARVHNEAPTIHGAVAHVHTGPGRMLEIGCSYGAMLDSFRSEGWDVQGVELDARAVDYGRRELGLRVECGRLEDARAALSAPFDVVAMYHVLEHVQSPLSMLRKVAEICAPGSALLIRTPNARALTAQILGGWWEWSAAPEHVHLFTHQSLRAVLADAGFRVHQALTRRGDAHGTFFEVIRGSTRRVVGMRPRSEFPPSERMPPSQRRWYRRIERTADVIGAPLDWATTALSMTGIPVAPELLVIAVLD